MFVNELCHRQHYWCCFNRLCYRVVLVGKEKKAVSIAKDFIEIKVVNGVYLPDVVQTQKGKSITLRFIREDETPCAGTVIFSDFNKSAELSVGKSVDITFTPDKTGEFEFTCQMGMYRGRLIVL